MPWDLAVTARQPAIVVVPTTAPSRLEGWANRQLSGTLTIALALFCIVIIAYWLPGRLTWPLWTDHDVFAVLAQGWEAGELPYRDRPTTNFPGPIYQAWVYGKLFGWGGSKPIYFLDTILIVGTGIACAIWSYVRLGWWLPGVAATAILVSYHATLDFAHAAQRDGQVATLVLLALLAVAGRERPRGSLVFSATFVAFALVSRPQVVLLLPAFAPALGWKWRVGLLWGSLVVALTALLFLPVIANGLFFDFLNQIRAISDGGIYAHAKTDTLAIHWKQLATGGATVVLLGSLLLRPRLAWPFVALAGAWFYRPLSPFPHNYLEQPLRTFLCVAVMVLLGSMLNGNHSNKWKLLGVLAILGCTIHFNPRCCEFDNQRKVWRALHGNIERFVPKGYTDASLPGLCIYPYHHDRQLIEYLSTRTSPDTKVANLLLSPAAVNGPAGRRTPLHAESMMWIIVVGRKEWDGFARELADTSDALVVWRPAEWEPVPEWVIIPDTLRRLYQHRISFGEIEVWERKPHDDSAATR
jgi:hypothetical protein